jgi:hypothetical protein
MCPFTTGDCLIEVTTWAGLTVCMSSVHLDNKKKRIVLL